MLLNSGSEAVSLACRISDSHAKIMTDNAGPHAGRNTILITLQKRCVCVSVYVLERDRSE
jgi:hypothetical protein